jgi:hypothetical protein
MKELKLPEKIISEYLRTGILSLGEAHGVKENYLVYEKIIEQLPIKPNLAIELGLFDKLEFENFCAGRKINVNKIYGDAFGNGVLVGDGRVTIESFTFLKNFTDKYPNRKITYLDEKLEDYGSRDFQQAKHFLENFEKPTLIIAGNLHSSKEKKEFYGNKIIPMGYYIKEKFGDFPYINIQSASGSYYNAGIVNITPDPERIVGEFIDLGNNNYKFYIEKASPTTQFK